MPDEPQTASHDLGMQLEPMLLAACDDRLGEVRWFRTGWQRGGAATAYAVLDGGSDAARDVVVKFPVPPREYRTLVGLDATSAPTPRLVFHGTELGNLEMAWVVMERLPGEPLRATPDKRAFQHITVAAAGFYKHAGELWPIEHHREPWDWEEMLSRARETAKTNGFVNGQHWSKVIHDVQRQLAPILAEWTAREINCWCHGDLHLGNAMLRPADSPWCSRPAADGDQAPKAECVLVDFGEVHPGHWVEDAIYLERVHWAAPELLKKAKPVSMIARARREAGLSTDDDYARLGQIRRLLMASCVPALRRENHPTYLEAALAVVEKTLPLVCK